MLWMIIGAVFLAGCIGGSINGRKADKWGLRYKNPKCDTWFLGVTGYALSGGIAAVLFWCLYGPLAETPVFGSGATTDTPLILNLGELAGSVLMGFGGQGWIEALSGKKCAERQLNNH